MSTTNLPDYSTATAASNPIPATSATAISTKGKAKEILTAPLNVLRYVFPEIDYSVQGISRAKDSIDKRRKSNLAQGGQGRGQSVGGGESSAPPPYELREDSQEHLGDEKERVLESKKRVEGWDGRNGERRA
jgi:hypothetical protein